MANLYDKRSGKSEDTDTTPSNIDRFAGSVSEMGNTLIEFNKEFKRNTDAFLAGLGGEFSKFARNNSRSNQEESDIGNEFLERLNRGTDKKVDKFQIVSSAAVKSFEVVTDYAIRKFTDATTKAVNDYNATFTAITVRQNWTAQEYSNQLRKTVEDFKNTGLNIQFDQTDFSAALQDALSMGMRDEIATRIATQNLITNKLLPQLNTNSRTYTRASKLLGDDLGKNVVAIGKYTEQLYGAEGLEDGQINNVIETIANEIIAGGAQKGLSEAQVSEQIGNVLGTYQQYSAQYGAQYAENVLGTLKGIMTGDTSDIMAMSAARDAGISLGDASSLTPEAISRYYSLYTQQTEEAGSRAGAGVMANMAGFGNYDNILAVQAGNAYGDKYQDWMSQVSGTVDPNALYKENVNDLANGFGQSITDQQDKWNTNFMSKFSTWAAQHIPDFNGVLGGITTILTTWFGTWVALNKAGALGDGGKGLGKLGKGATSLLTKTGMLEATAEGGTALTSGLGWTAGTVGAGAMLAGGLIWGGVDTGKAVSRAKASGQNVFGAGLQGFFTGDSTAGMSNTEKEAYYQQHGYFSIEDVLKNAGKGALIGGGVGTAVGGWALGSGTLIGGAVGAATGIVSSIASQLTEAHHFKELQEATQNAADSISKMSSVADGYGTAVQNNASLMKDYYTIMDEDKRSTKEGTEAFNRLKDAYPEMLGNVEDVSKLDETYIGQLKTKIELEKIELDKKLKDAGNYDLDVSAYTGSDQLNQAAYEFADWAKNNKDFTEDEANAKVAEIADKYYNGDTNKAMELIRNNLGRGVINQYKTYDENGLFNGFTYGFDTGNSSSVFNYDYESALSTNEDTLNQIFDTGSGPWGQVYNEYLMLQQAYEAAVSAADGDISKADFTAVRNSAETFSKHMTKFKDDILKGPATTRYENQYRPLLSGIPEIYEAIDMKDDMPSFRIGTDFITQGGPIMSHLGEAVLTADTTKKLNYLANGSAGITGYINMLYSLGQNKVNASAVGMDTELSLDPIVDAIREQTAELKESLLGITALITALVPSASLPVADQILATYQGASA